MTTATLPAKPEAKRAAAKKPATPTEAALRRQLRTTLKTLNEELHALSLRSEETLNSLRALRNK